MTAFTCDNGDMIASNWECDGYPDCSDGSDEPTSCPGKQSDSGAPSKAQAHWPTPTYS